MRIDDYMNPNRKNENVDVFIKSGKLIEDISPKDIKTKFNYVGVVDNREHKIGAIRTERINYLVACNGTFSFSSILDNLSLGVIAIDMDSRIFYVNSSYADILGVAPGKIIGRYLNDVEKDAGLLQVLTTKKRIQTENQRIKSINKYVNTDMFPIYKDGKIFGACSIFSDVTELNILTDELDRVSRVANEYKKEIQIAEDVIGESKKYRETIEIAKMVSGTDAAVLIRGENGTGKEVISKLIQENSLRSDQAFIKVNCAAIPETLMESEFFGYEEGSFTGAKKGGSPGKFELANKGTIFLDEIGDLPLSMQGKLLRVLQENEITRVGGNEPIPVDVRVISATNQDLQKMIDEKKFRMDLYYRLNVVEINVPPLRERENDIVLLANKFLGDYNSRYSKEKTLSSDSYETLLNHNWPGNVRELRNIIESAAILSQNDIITSDDLSRIASSYGSAEAGAIIDNKSPSRNIRWEATPLIDKPLKEELADYEREIITNTLKHFQGNRRRAMEHLGMTERTFYRKLSEYDIQ